MRRIILGLFLITATTGTIVFAASSASKSTPEDVVARFIEGYRRGDEAMVLSTLHESAGGPEPMIAGREETFRILEKLLVLNSSDETSKAGDIYLRVQRQIKFVTGYQEMVTNFRLRKIKEEWKIVGYAANY